MRLMRMVEADNKKKDLALTPVSAPASEENSSVPPLNSTALFAPSMPKREAPPRSRSTVPWLMRRVKSGPIAVVRLSVNVPAPDLTRVPEPVTSPVKLVLPDWLSVSEFVSSATVPPFVPPPDSDPMVSFESTSRITLAVLAKVTATVSASALPLVRTILPSLWATAPVNVLLPASSSVPAPSLVKVPVPVAMASFTVMFPAPPMVRF